MVIIAKTVSNKMYSYECPVCWTRYKLNGEPYKNATRKIHWHGSFSTKNRTEYPIRHCGIKMDLNEIDAHEIIIDDSTIRC
jgi:hypothetical protein